MTDQAPWEVAQAPAPDPVVQVIKDNVTDPKDVANSSISNLANNSPSSMVRQANAPAPTPAPASTAEAAPWEVAQQGKPAPAVPPDPTKDKELAAIRDKEQYEAASDFDYNKSPLRYILSEDNARALVQSQRRSNDRDDAFNTSMENAVLLGAGNWLSRQINPDQAAQDAASRDLHPTAAGVGTGVGSLYGMTGLAKAGQAALMEGPTALEEFNAQPTVLGQATKGVIDFLSPAAGWIKNAATSSVSKIAGGVTGAELLAHAIEKKGGQAYDYVKKKLVPDVDVIPPK